MYYTILLYHITLRLPAAWMFPSNHPGFSGRRTGPFVYIVSADRPYVREGFLQIGFWVKVWWILLVVFASVLLSAFGPNISHPVFTLIHSA
jgi:hypothetical protein